MKNLAVVPGTNVVTLKREQCDCRPVGGYELNFEGYPPIIHVDDRADVAC